jgi:hypothetical protein
MYMLGLTFGFVLSVPLHELGHLLFGKLTGYKFLSFQLLHFLWTKDESGKLQVTKSPLIRGAIGQCLLIPCEGESRFHFVLYNMGGGLVNLLCAVPFFVAFLHSENAHIAMLFFGFAVSSAILAILNLLPIKRQMIPNDGANILEARKSLDAEHGFYLMLKVNAEMAKGKLLQQYPVETFALSEIADLSNYLVANMVFLRASVLDDLGEFERSRAELLRVDTAKLPPFYAAQIEMQLLFNDVVHNGSAEAVDRARDFAESKVKNKLWNKILTMKHPAFMPYNAAKIALIDGDKEQARAVIAEARKQIPSMHNPGDEYSTALKLDRLEARLQ